MMFEFQIMTVDNETAIEASNRLKTIGVIKDASSLFYGEFLVAINGDDVIALAENISPTKNTNRANVFYFKKMKKKHKSKIKVAFFNKIFSRRFWLRNKNSGTFKENFSREKEYMFL